jgi:hypothetical protein
LEEDNARLEEVHRCRESLPEVVGGKPRRRGKPRTKGRSEQNHPEVEVSVTRQREARQTFLSTWRYRTYIEERAISVYTFVFTKQMYDAATPINTPAEE